MKRCPCISGCGYNNLVPFSLTLDDHAPEAEYRKDATCHARHAGQLKLLCSEVSFLRQFQAPVVVYAGSSPGLHIPRLASMFPAISLFVLIDPHESAVADGGRFRILWCLMTEHLARELRMTYGPDILFISDVRTAPPSKKESNIKQQARIQKDMESQMRWHQALDPVASMFKFRLPWTEPRSHYLEGIIHLPVFGWRLTHETRLVVRRGAKIVEYDNHKYERQMAYFNRVVRTYALFQGRCYDCAAFRAICGEELADEIEEELNMAGKAWFQSGL